MRRVEQPEALALARIGLGLATILNAYEMHRLLTGLAEGRLRIPLFEALPAPTHVTVWAVTLLATAAGAALVLGWRPAAAAGLATAVSVWCLVWDQQTYSNHRILALVLVVLLAFARSDRAWAVRPSAGPPSSPWVQLLMMTQLSVCYLFAGLSKMNPVFPSGYPFDTWLWLDLPHALDMTIALATIATEVFLAVGLWFARTRVVAVVLGLLLHASIVALMSRDNLTLFAFMLTCTSLYPLFHTWVLPTADVADGASPARQSA